MIHNDVLSQLQLLIKTSAPPLLEVSQQQLALPQLTPGQRVPAHVMANLPNGRFQVLIADKALDMNLPKNTQPGDTLELIFVSGKPRLTFILASDLANVATTSAAGKPQVSLSETARFLGGLLEKAAQPESAQAKAVSIAQTAPLLSGAPGKTLHFAQVLHGALTKSGLFYESHQAQWVAGQRPLTDLLHEPQGRLSPAAAHIAAQNVKPAEMQQTSALVQNQGDALSAKPLAATQLAHPETVPIVRQQLDALDTRQVLWQGQVWPGQTMDWQIEERSAREQEGGEVEQAEWQTSLHLVLPQLGEINARLILHPQGIRIQLGAAEFATVELMSKQKTALQQGMETSGLRLAEIKIGAP
ncbi:MAG: flagellar hook-length control protein FliK [Gammaproteobacteria bacterium]|nr:flagellar hook-length control protein FliK [Gammaproteobacteria bacterium]MBU1732428.1 flagellar hook-length control protein FliK [Gammaproteobacteria bacterium]MBU1893998.1 flagellar hook-length control protein FliK [Gammaproteobacteria bacterium]